MKTVCALTSICEEDAEWIPGYLEEASRLGIPFVVHFDRCSEETKRLVRGHMLFRGATEQNDPSIEFNETAKQPAMELLSQMHYDWAMAWDVDEIYAFNAAQVLEEILRENCDLIDIKWVNCWNDVHTLRVDGSFSGGHRTKFMNLQPQPRVWAFTHPVVNGAYLQQNREAVTIKRHEFVCLHLGMMTERLRELHRQRWDRIYTKAVGNNPYGTWNWACDKSITPQLIENPYR